MEHDTHHAPGALDLVVEERGDLVTVTVVGQAEEASRVEYELVVEGSSRTAHRGKSEVRPGAAQVLSTVRVNRNPGYCATLSVKQDGSEEYVIRRGACA